MATLREDLDNTLIPAPVEGFVNADETAGQTIEPRTLGSINAPTRQEDDQIAWEAQGGSIRGLGPVSDVANFFGAVGDSFQSGGNIAFDIQRTLYRKFASGDIDPTFSQSSFIARNAEVIPENQRWRWLGTTNIQEAQWLLDDYKDNIHKQRVTVAKGGFTAFSAGVISGIVDIDAPLMFLSGGLTAGAKAGINATKFGRMLAGSASGAALGLGLGAASYQFNPTGEADDIIFSAMFGTGLGFIGGAVRGAPDLTADLRTNVVNETGEGITFGRPTASNVVPAETAPLAAGKAPLAAEGDAPAGSMPDGAQPAPRAPRAVSVAEAVNDPTLEGTGGSFSGADASMGARATGVQYDGPGLGTITNPDHVQVIADAIQWKRTSGDLDGWEDPNYTGGKVNEAVARQGTWLGRVASKLGVGNDFAKMINSDNPVYQKLAVMLMEDPSGKVRKNTTAATLQNSYTYEFGRHVKMFDEAARKYFKDEQGLSMWDAEFGNAKNWEQEFYRMVQLELHDRKYGRTSNATPSVKEAADAMGKFYEMDVNIGKGRSNELPIEAYKDLEVDPTYAPQQWSGRQMQELMETARKTGGAAAYNRTRLNIIKTIEDEYARLHPLIDPKDRKIYATAVFDRATTTRKNIGRDLLGLLQGDEGGIVRSALTRNGIAPAEIDRVLEALIGSRDAKARPGHTQERIDVDFGSVSSSGIKMIDLLDNDIKDQMMKRMSRTSGQAALARQGIGSKIEFEKWIGAAKAFDETRGKRIDNSGTRAAPINDSLGARGQALADKLDDSLDEATDAAELGEALWSYFSGGAVAGGISPAYARIRKVTQLALMNQLGLTSIAEFGPIAANAGWHRFRDHISEELRSQLNKIDSPLMGELKHMAFFVPEEVMFNPRFNHESEKLASSGEVMSVLDKVLNRGQQLQGAISGFYKVREMQQRVALTSTVARIFEGLQKADAQFSPQRLADMGFENTAVFQKYINNGMVQFDANGNLVKLNMDQWDYDDVQYFRNGMTRTVNQLVQKALTGESNLLFHKDGAAQLFWQLKSFPLLAMEKQFNRNMRLGDSVTRMTFINGLIFAGIAYSARQLVNARGDNLTPEKIARGALNYSNMTGWLPMWVDPVAAMLGLQDFNASGYSSQGMGSVVSIPAAFSVADRLFQLPGSAIKVAGNQFGWAEYTNDDIRNLQMVPIVGGMFGMSAILNTMKGHGKFEPPPKNYKEPAEPKPAPEPVPEETPAATVLQTALEASKQ